MPNISEKGHSMPASPIRKLVPYSEAAKKAGRTVYHLNIGQPDIETPEIVMEKIRQTEIKVIEYSNSEGMAAYRTGLVGYYKTKDINIEPTDLMVTTGGSEALVFAFMTCLNPGDEIIITENYQTVARLRSESDQAVRRPPPGLGKGSVLYMAPDFDEPLAEMKEYTE